MSIDVGAPVYIPSFVRMGCVGWCERVKKGQLVWEEATRRMWIRLHERHCGYDNCLMAVSAVLRQGMNNMITYIGVQIRVRSLGMVVWRTGAAMV